MEAPPAATAAAPTSPPSNSDSTPPPSDTIYTPPSVEVSPPSPSPLAFPSPSTSPPTPSSLPPTPSSSPSTPSSDQNPSVPSPTQLPSNPPSGRTPPAPSTPAPSGGAPPPEPSNDASPPVPSGVISPPPPSGRGSHPPPSGRDAHPPPPGKESHPPPPSGNNVRPPGRGSHPAPPGSISPQSPSGTSRPPPPSSGGGSSSWPTDTVVGVAIGCAAVVVIVSLLCILFKKNKKGRQHPESYMPPPPPPGPKVQPYGEQVQNWQQSMPPPARNVIIMPPKPSPPSVGFSRLPPPPPPYMSSSGASESNYSGTETPRPLLSPNLSFGATKSMFTYEELALATDGFSDAMLLGQGGFGYVHKGVFPDGKEVAIKKLKADSGQGDREFQAEVEIISRVHHKHLVSLVGYCVTGMERILVYDFVPNNTLEFHLHARGRPVVDWSMRLKIALGAARGLAYLHEDCHPKIIHRDIKASNILLDFSFEAKVADFGLAKLSSDDHTHVSTRVMGTFGYLAPEYASSGKLTEKSDVFSFGVVLLELITGRRPLITDVTILEDSLVDWARPLLIRALEDGNFDVLVDTRIRNIHNHDEMARMMACAAACVRHSAKRRPRMSQVVRALEGDASLCDLNEGTIPGNSSVFGSYRSSGRDSSQYSEVMKKLRKTAFSSQEYGTTTGQYSNPTSDYGLNPSGSSSEDQQTREIRCLHRKGK